mmetsp:Transcript_55819/g.88468  ORF Transcript_55819/g.88468 Transcript_55819/m.88468 type:complete len:203 (-) Transcript_55819:353-961(-)
MHVFLSHFLRSTEKYQSWQAYPFHCPLAQSTALLLGKPIVVVVAGFPSQSWERAHTEACLPYLHSGEPHWHRVYYNEALVVWWVLGNLLLHLAIPSPNAAIHRWPSKVDLHQVISDMQLQQQHERFGRRARVFVAMLEVLTETLLKGLQQTTRNRSHRTWLPRSTIHKNFQTALIPQVIRLGEQEGWLPDPKWFSRLEFVAN